MDTQLNNDIKEIQKRTDRGFIAVALAIAIPILIYILLTPTY